MSIISPPDQSLINFNNPSVARAIALVVTTIALTAIVFTGLGFASIGILATASLNDKIILLLGSVGSGLSGAYLSYRRPITDSSSNQQVAHQPSSQPEIRSNIQTQNSSQTQPPSTIKNNHTIHKQAENARDKKARKTNLVYPTACKINYTESQLSKIKSIANDMQNNLLKREVIDDKKVTILKIENKPYLLLTHRKIQKDSLVGEGFFKRAKFAIDLSNNEAVVVCISSDATVSVCTENESSDPVETATQEFLNHQACSNSHYVLPTLGMYKDGDKRKVYLLTPYCEGGTLAQASLQADENQIIRWILEVISGIKDIQNQGIIHSDIHAENILVRDNVAQISDFGKAVRFNNRNRKTAGQIDYKGVYKTIQSIVKARWSKKTTCPEKITKLLRFSENFKDENKFNLIDSAIHNITSLLTTQRI